MLPAMMELDVGQHYMTGWSPGPLRATSSDANGGAEIFGLPLAYTGGYRTDAQGFERARFEQHPAYASKPYDILLGLLGAEEAQERGLMETLPFRDEWRAHGLDLGGPGVSYRESLALFGFPISEEFTDLANSSAVQYFERVAME